MSLYILDTDHLSQLQRGNQNIASRIANLEPESIAITVISVEEQLRGRFAKIREAETNKNQAALPSAYRKLRVTFEFLTTYSILDFTDEARDDYLHLKQTINIGRQDLKIAAIVRSVNAIVVTRNQKDFSKVPDLSIQDWTV